MTIEIFTLGNCPRCEELAEFLSGLSVPFDTLSLDDAETITELRINGVFVTEAPVLHIGDTWLLPSQIFQNGYLAIDQIAGLIEEGHDV